MSADADLISLNKRLNRIDWHSVTHGLRERGFARVPSLLSPEHCSDLIGIYDRTDLYRKTVNMARYRFGAGEYRYFRYPLPEIIGNLREALYPHLVSVANDWNRALRIDRQFPEAYGVLQEQCKAAGQLLPTPLILKYREGGYNTLHQDLYGDVYFPIQVVFLLSDQERDFSGGEFVLIEQLPRAQSRANVIRLQLGDALIFTTRFRPVRGTKGYYRVNVKHGISEVHQGTRYSMGIIFHDAIS